MRRTTRRLTLAAILTPLLVLPGPTEAEPAQPRLEAAVTQRGLASFYSDRLEGRRTASGVRHRQDRRTAASRTLPLGSRATVTNEETGQSVEVTIIDRGPYVHSRIIDLSKSAAEQIGMLVNGVVAVRVEAWPSAQPTRRLKELVARQAKRQAQARERCAERSPSPPCP